MLRWTRSTGIYSRSCFHCLWVYTQNGIPNSYDSSVLNLGENHHTTSIVAIPVYIPTNSAQVFLYLQTLPPSLLSLVFFDDSHSAMYVVLICIYLIISDIKHFFIYLLVICISSLEKCLFNSSACFKRIIWNCSENCSHFDISYKARLWVMYFFSFYLLVKVCLLSEEQIWLV